MYTIANTSLFDWYGDEPTEKMTVLIFAEPTDVRYFHAQLLPTDVYGVPQWDALTCGETPYYEVHAASALVTVTYPVNTSLGEMRYLDANKNAANVQSGTWYGSSTGIF